MIIFFTVNCYVWLIILKIQIIALNHIPIKFVKFKKLF